MKKHKNTEGKKQLILELAHSSCLANRERIWQLINEIGKEEIEKDNNFCNELIKISISQLNSIVKGERIF